LKQLANLIFLIGWRIFKRFRVGRERFAGFLN
jgi:hypothetical protein